MPKVYLNIFADGGCLLEPEAAGDQSIELDLDEQTANTLHHLLSLDSFNVAAAAGRLAWVSIQLGHKQSRRLTA
ncbi:MAG TPA: hypothetical protein VD866_01275 [Urbifossiella sp.]|nr:hypothetical protein [Urbifossiella sp.]